MADQRISDIAKTRRGRRRKFPLSNLRWAQIGYEFVSAKVAEPDRKTESIISEITAKHDLCRAAVWKILQRVRVAVAPIPWPK